MTPISRDRLLEVLDYNPDTGIFTWKITLSNRAKAGQIAGVVNNTGHIRISIDKHKYYAHSLAWFYMYGVWPRKLMDHINRNPADNRICNLREASKSQNSMNRELQSNNISGTTGVWYSLRQNRWCARITVDNQIIGLGTYKTLEEAVQARKIAESKYFGEFAP